MCGIVGWLGNNIDGSICKRMLSKLSHRGPDDEGEWYDDTVWLGQRRLSIVDLSSGGHQPMVSSTGRYVISYNGEIYNYIEVRDQLKNSQCQFKTDSDTEVILSSFETWGIRQSLQQFNGMFAIAVWDRQEKSLTLVRDRMGEKPLYYAECGNNIAFASELSAMWDLPWLDKHIDTQALQAYFRYLCVPAPLSILKGVKKLRPGAGYCWKNGIGKSFVYWSVDKTINDGVASSIDSNLEEAADELQLLLNDSVKIRLRSDVPYGAMLSSGVDSSLITAVMQQQTSRPVATFTIGFSDKQHDESTAASNVSSYLGTRNFKKILSSNEVIQLVPETSKFQDEPFADSSSIPTYLLSKFAKQHVSVAIAGDGGDELFGGYPRYFWAKRIQNYRNILTPFGASLTGRMIKAIPKSVFNTADQVFTHGRYSGAQGLGLRAHRFATYLQTDPNDYYHTIASTWNNPSQLLANTLISPDIFTPAYNNSSISWSDEMMASDQMHFLPNDILTKTDRASMSVGLEMRSPLLDHRLVEWSWRLRHDIKYSDNGDTGKLILRTLLNRYIPLTLTNPVKMGFSMPIGQWLRADLRDWVESLIGRERLIAAGLNPDVVSNVWKLHLQGHDHFLQIWTVLMWMQWIELWPAEF